ncbi:MAG: carotenoid oxygenase family protein [Pseudomonadales bacterium]|jgi:all-trans-8'-apo-beta-carotenal 15,15'-oxygenase|nr:carotenoid oxygenase family protein [Pseudomonadales bacterium]
MPTTNVQREALRVLRRSFETVGHEYDDLELEVRGRLPVGLEGVLYRNGPGRMERGGQAYGHLFDGDGHVCRFAFEGGRVRYRNRFVRTAAFEEEEAAGRVLHRCLGTNRPGGPLANAFRFDFRNAANTHVIRHADRLFALYEGGAPHELDPVSLATLGPWNPEGTFDNPFDRISRSLRPELPFAAHPTLDPRTGELVGFGLLPGRPNRLLTYRIDAHGHCVERRHFELGGSSFVHDALLTERWQVFLLPQVDYGLAGILFGFTTAAGSMSMHTERPMKALLVPRDGGDPVCFETLPGFVFHFAGGADHADGTLHLNLVHHRTLPALGSVDELIESGEGLGQLTRLDIDPVRGTTRTTLLSEHAHEMPRTGGDGRRIYSCGVPAGRNLPFYTAILATELAPDGGAVATRVRDFHPDLPGEPVPVVADGAEWLLLQVYRAEEHRSELLVLAAEDLSTVASMALPHSLPPGFHGSWVGATERPPATISLH